MRLQATIRSVTGNTTHLQSVLLAGELEVIPVPDPITVEVVEQEGQIFLLRLDEQGKCVADTWHESVEDAKAQANFEYGIKDDDWRDAEQER